MQIINKDLRKKIKFCIGLFCANNNTILGTKYFLHNSGINENEVKKIKYRGLGWPGKYQIELNNGKIVILDRAISEPSFKRKLLISSSFHYDFMIPRCLLCVDHSAELADISLADPWLKEYLFTEKAGKSIIISRNSIGKSIVSLAHQEGVIFIEKIDDFEILNKAQNYRFKAGAGSRIKLRSMIGKAVPNYGKRPLSIKSRALFEYPFYIFSYFSHIPWVRKVLPINSHFRHFVKKVFDKIFI